jgi:hypothetical protein
MISFEQEKFVALDVYKDWLGIPEGERPPNLYQLLRLVQFEDDISKIRKHYAKLNAHVRKYASGQYATESQNLLNELAKAMLCLTDPDRKQEFDESLGRESESSAGEGGRKSLEQVLVDQGDISTAQAKEAESFADARGLSMRDAVVQMKLVDAEAAAQALAVELGRPFVDLNEMFPDDSVLDKIPRSLVKRNVVLPLFVDDDCLLIACVHEPEPELEEELRLRFGIPMRAVIATPLAVNQAIAKYYAPGMRDEAVVEEATAASGDGKKKKRKKGKKKADSAKSKKAKSDKAPAEASLTKVEDLSPDEKKERKQLGIIMLCWGFVGPIMFDEFILKPYVMPDVLNFGYVPSLTTLLVAPTVVWYVLKVYWK